MKRKAFTLIEVILVIVVMGIIGTITTDIIGALYRSYNNQAVINDLTLKTSNALNIITKRLDNSIKESIAYDNDFKAIQQKTRNISDSNDSEPLFWIGIDTESFKLDGNLSRNGYSGFIAVPSSDGRDMNATDSNKIAIETTQSDITGISPYFWINTALYFPYAVKDQNVSDMFYDYDATLNQEKPSALFPVSTMTQIGSDVNITLSREPDTIVERFYLTYSAYALEQNNGDLILYYNFRPWNEAIDLTADDQNQTIIIDNVSSFEYWSEGEGSIIRFRLCVSDDERYMAGSGDDEDRLIFCKESAIIR